jgi:hypothetical protein
METLMPWYEFTLILADCKEMTDGLADSLYAVGCNDGTPCSSGESSYVCFCRAAESLEAAIRSAIADMKKAGCKVKAVTLKPDCFENQVIEIKDRKSPFDVPGVQLDITTAEIIEFIHEGREKG